MADTQDLPISDKLPQVISIEEFNRWLDPKLTRLIEQKFAEFRSYQKLTRYVSIGQY